MTEIGWLAVLADTARAATAERDAAICAAVAAGSSLRAVSSACGLSHQTIANIAERHK